MTTLVIDIQDGTCLGSTLKRERGSVRRGRLGGGGGVRESQKRGFSRYTFPFSKPLQ